MKFYSISGSDIFRKTSASGEEEDTLATELAEQKTRTAALQKSIEEQNKLLVSMAKQLQDLTGVASTSVRRLMKHDNNSDTVDARKSDSMDSLL